MQRKTNRWPNGRVLLINHRGLSPGYPENTLTAFTNALAMGVDVIELDLRGSLDGVAVVLHDPTVDRTTKGIGAVAGLTLTELKRLDAGSRVAKRFSNERIPTYEDVLQLTSRTTVSLLLDIKQGSTLKCDVVVGLTEKHNALLRTIIGARTVDDVRLFRSLNPNLRILGLSKRRKDIKSLLTAGADIIRVWPDWIDADDRLMARLRKASKPIWATAGDATPQELLRLIRLGINGILTDRPKTLAKLIGDIDEGRIRL